MPLTLDLHPPGVKRIRAYDGGTRVPWKQNPGAAVEIF
jgi:hypothetical protein